MTYKDFQLQNMSTFSIMRNHFNFRQGIHVITNLTTDRLANMLNIINSSNDTIIIYAKEK